MKTKEKAIKHYKEMIEWAETQDLTQKPSWGKMRKDIKQDWYSDYCSYCHKYFKNLGWFYICNNCKLNDGSGGDRGCCGGLWSKMNKSKKWRTWIKYAKKVLEYIELNG